MKWKLWRQEREQEGGKKLVASARLDDGPPLSQCVCRTDGRISNALCASSHKDLIEVIQEDQSRANRLSDERLPLLREVLSQLRESLQLDWTQLQVACVNVIRAVWTLAGQEDLSTYVTLSSELPVRKSHWDWSVSTHWGCCSCRFSLDNQR